MPRSERDALGELVLPDGAYYGVQTARALVNFPVGGFRTSPDMIRAYVLVKKAAAMANVELGALDKGKGKLISRAADEILAGGLAEQFLVDAFQAGAGTSTNMNVNEVMANRALELAGRPKGDYAFIGPNDHVNMSQSSNDTFPTACHLAVIFAADRLLPSLSALAAALEEKSREFATVQKPGRTHLMDALPLKLGDEFRAWATALRRAGERVAQRKQDLYEVAIGGTAVGTGANVPAGFRSLVVAKLSDLAGLALAPARDSFEALQSRAQLAAFSGSLRELAQELGTLANNLRLLGSGPVAGLGEILLPAVQPGSSIMPGKVNPSLCECLNMICFQVIGNDLAVSLAAQAGQLELNVFAPVMVHNILGSLSLLGHFLPVFTERCVAGIRADEPRCRAYLDLNPALATLLAPRIGYLAAAALAKEALEKHESVRQLTLDKGIVSPEEADKLFGPGTESK
ncbi:aspartate ammonia-lyase [candidate division WOR-3 bacterium]|uniref:Aspartate ammonia-lyase n=1 Tax=candidate division WOR-3 bacterium TaxID=2052148 RepID=A0A937XH77_UNCW3|nr:aspartate ammonia-lyase [candidate division WOR-3 bacterium]